MRLRRALQATRETGPGGQEAECPRLPWRLSSAMASSGAGRHLQTWPKLNQGHGTWTRHWTRPAPGRGWAGEPAPCEGGRACPGHGCPAAASALCTTLHRRQHPVVSSTEKGASGEPSPGGQTSRGVAWPWPLGPEHTGAGEAEDAPHVLFSPPWPLGCRSRPRLPQFLEISTLLSLRAPQGFPSAWSTLPSPLPSLKGTSSGSLH